MFWQLVCLLLVSLAGFFLLCTYYVKRHTKGNKGGKQRSSKSLRLCAVAGSGGHTTELLFLMSAFKKQFGYRAYIVAGSDKLSEQKILEFERSQSEGDFLVERISRSREVGQNYFTSVFTTFCAWMQSLFLIWKIRPDLVLCNGPGVCIPICFAAALFDLLRLRDVRIYYVESLCRVKKLSLTGQILYHTRISDIFFVHWEDLVEQYPLAVLVPSCN